jgi:hypothetical protein
MDHMALLNAPIAKKNSQNQNVQKNHQKKENHVNGQAAHSVEKNSQDHHHLNAKNVEKNFISHILDHMDLMDLMDHMKVNIHMDLMDHMDQCQNLFAKNVEKNLNSQNLQQNLKLKKEFRDIEYYLVNLFILNINKFH